ncbi:MAN1-like protein [Mya arenaria]|uniref:MAN1-like protein n=1 Tax=Mya arenaria TaxID=6604 RepID=A0ABY7FV78_MYAAR|nr:MAN1-like protein [Mya arenaria]
MADKLNDNEIASEFKRFGETIKLPIDKKKRPILLKKLNHYYAKENPPPKRTKIFARPSRKSQPIAEFSDESQDESESTRNISNITAKRNRTRNNLRESPVKRVQAKDRDNGATVSPGIRARNVRNRQITNVQQMEVYPEEFSDTDTADESLYVEEKSIGINTTMSYEDEDEEEENEIVTHASPRNMSGNLSTISHINTSVNNVDNKVDDEESGQFVSKTILFAMAIFFLALGFSYLYVRKDIFFASDREAAVSQTDLKETTFLENGTKITFTTFEISNGSLPLLKKNDTQVERILQLSFFLILQNDWDIMRLLQSLWEEAVKFIETNESRIRVETQVIQGEEFNVWSEQTTDDWHLDIEESILEKCQDNHGILHIFVDRSSKEGCVYIKCSSCEKAYGAYQALHGWWFDGRLVTVKYLRLEHYHDRFPDSRNCRHPLKPSKPEMTSVSRPYHRSALEMT